jgi:tetratricopeptide (TPR) repeat protein
LTAHKESNTRGGHGLDRNISSQWRRGTFYQNERSKTVKSILYILIAILSFSVAVPAFAQEKEQKDAAIAQMRQEVDRIYAIEHGKRSKDEITHEYMKRSEIGAYNDLITQKLKQKDYDGARQMLNVYASRMSDKNSDYKGVKTLPEEAMTMHLGGDLERTTGHSKEAIDYYEKALVINPDMATAHYNLFWLYAVAGKNELGQQHLKRSFELDESLIELAKKQMQQMKEQQGGQK